ncbi:HlyD family efflux transporter periplasmic adaptor subunit [Alishewanella tabrizica]|uniref:Toxin secretion, membrane fusion protein n=1 Tax=Alishewanella tabrizica TaxID=671278 RepID=A0ABQ2WRQ0_9ALTE|nr:efflux RND transporter periplasmic adaptor subunit [Alishewanella tabrizica]GGW70301.1 toxin secretion, membrane fusion protein [Alishewanella tabrizica]
MTQKPLFRLAAIKQQANRLEGEVIIAQPLSSSILTGSLLAIVVAIIGFLATADFNRKETVSGYLQPDIGLAKVHAARAGIISELYVEDGASVIAGQALLTLTIPDHLAEGNSVVESISLTLQQQQQLIAQRREQLQLQYQQQQHELQSRLVYHQSVLTELHQQTQLLQHRLQLQQQRFSDLSQLKEQGVISTLDWQLQHESLLQLQQQAAEHNASQQSQLASLVQLEGQLQRIPSEQQQQLALLEAESSRLAQQQVELRARNHLLVTAPVSGRVTNLVAEPGQFTQHTQPLLTILPENAQLHAILLVPTRAFGFVNPGQRTRLRFEAFPYQRFGLYEGQVLKTGQAIILPNEVAMPIAIQEPVYRVAVALDAQEIRAYGNSVPLQSGMLLSADIVLEQRSLLSWLLEPILSLKGRL